MEALFLKLLNMSITASWLVLAVVILRLLLKKAPKSMICFLWLLVAIRLVFPISIESVVSLIPSTETITEESLYSDTPVIDSGINAVNDRVNPVISESLAPAAGDSVNPMQVIVYVASYVWVIGMLGMLIYAIVSYFRLWIKVREAVVDGERIWLCDRISTPFILGIIRPRIYIPSWVEKADKEYVIAHERAHLKRKDHWWKPLGFILLTVYWFNPVMWLAYVLLCKDIEYACDEKVLIERGIECKKDYSNALVNCSVSRKSVAMCPLAFGEVGVKNRIKSVLSYKQPAFWVIIGAIAACAVFTVAFMTNPRSIKHCGSDMTVDELQENFANCLKEYSIYETPELEIGMETGHIRKVSFNVNISGEGIAHNYLEYLQDILASAVMAYGGTQYEKLPGYVKLDYVRNDVLLNDIVRAFNNGKCESYYENMYIDIAVASEGYKFSNGVLLMDLESEEHYINMTCTMENNKVVCGEYYLKSDLFAGSGPIVNITLNEDGSYAIARGTGDEGDIVGTYEQYDNEIALENYEDSEWYVFEVVDANTIKILPDSGHSIKVYYGNGVARLDEGVFVSRKKQNTGDESFDVEAELYVGEDSHGQRPQEIVRQYYEYLEENDVITQNQWFTNEYLKSHSNAYTQFQHVRLLDMVYCVAVEAKYIRESDQAWIDEIEDKYKSYCFIQTEAQIICEEDGALGYKGETINQQYYFALVIDPEDGRWKIAEYGYPGYDVMGIDNLDEIIEKASEENSNLKRYASYVKFAGMHRGNDDALIWVMTDWGRDNIYVPIYCTINDEGEFLYEYAMRPIERERDTAVVYWSGGISILINNTDCRMLRINDVDRVIGEDDYPYITNMNDNQLSSYYFLDRMGNEL